MKLEDNSEVSSTHSFDMSEAPRSASESAEDLKSRSDSKGSISLPPIQHVLQRIDDYQNQQKIQDSELLLAFTERKGSSEAEPQSPEGYQLHRAVSNPPEVGHPPHHISYSHSTSHLPTAITFQNEGPSSPASGKLTRSQRSHSYSTSMPGDEAPSRASSIGSTESLTSAECSTPGSANSKKRTNLPRETIEVLNDWIVNNLDNPYPNHTQKRLLLERTGLSNVQLSNWFINKRRRRLFSNLSGNQGYPIKKKRLIDRV